MKSETSDGSPEKQQCSKKLNASTDGILVPGDILANRYRITKLISCGGMGQVYEAEHLRLKGLKLAVKILLGKRLTSEEALSRFRREAELTARLKHPHIISIIDWDTMENGTPYFVMEFLQGETLASRMKLVEIEEGEAIEIIKQVCKALIFAHSKGVIHRDLKPSNIFLVDTGGTESGIFVKLFDFGISKDIYSETLKATQSTIIGTPGYMSPEQAKGLNNLIDARSDIFSLGAIAYELLANRPAFQSDTIESILYRIVHEPADPLDEINPHINPTLAKVIHKALSKDPDDRFASVSSFLAALNSAQQSSYSASSSSVLKDSLAESDKDALPAQRSSTRKFTRVITYLLIGVVLTLFVIYAVTHYQVRKLEHENFSVLPPDNIQPQIPDPQDLSTPLNVSSPQNEPSSKPPSESSVPVTKKKIVAKKDEKIISEDVRQKLTQGLKLLDQGKYSEAIEITRQTLYMQKTVLAWKILVIAHCGLRDLGGANAFLEKLSKNEKKEVIQKCKEIGLDLH